MSGHNRHAQKKFTLQMRHRINAGRVAIRNQVDFFVRQFGQVASEWKPDETRVTFADFAISEKLMTELRADFVSDDFCSEEANPMDEVYDLEADFAWIIDPVDGTNNYALGSAHCAISLGLLYRGEPVYGFIYDHSLRALLEGGPGYGVLRNQEKLSRPDCSEMKQAMIGCHFPMNPDQLNHLAPLLHRYRVRALGSSALTFAYVATGYLAGVIDYRVKVWDIAAAAALCLGAGLEFTFMGASPFPMKTFHPQSAYCPCYCSHPDLIDQFKEASLYS